MLPVAILCGGKGTRMREAGETLPKPLVEIGGRPILWHVMALYAAQGFGPFFLLRASARSGSRRSRARSSGMCGASTRAWRRPRAAGWRGLASCSQAVTFCLTYADGVADIDLAGLVAFHREHGRAATVTVVRPENPWGVAQLADDGRVTGFEEKPQLDSWVNGGFFVMEPRALDFIGEDDVLERAPLERLAAAGELQAYRHAGFWDCMDTYKDNLLLNELWERGEAPWRPLVEA